MYKMFINGAKGANVIAVISYVFKLQRACFFMDVEDKFRNRFRLWRNEIYDHRRVLLASLIFLIIAGILSYLSGQYVISVSGPEVPDLLLDNFGPYDLEFIFVYGFLSILALMLVYPLFFRVNKLHVLISQFSLLVAIRSLFIVLTHLQTPADAIPVNFPGVLALLKFYNDSFFSGHVAISFLGFLLFRKEKIGYLFLLLSLVMGVTVILTHQHYSIDVLGAFFVTYASYKIGDIIFRKINHY